MDAEQRDESAMEATGMGLLPGLVSAIGLVVIAMAALLTGSMWAVWGVLAVIGVCVAAVVFVVVAVTSEGEQGRRLQALAPGLSGPTLTEREEER
jgi:hypothetical protein